MQIPENYQVLMPYLILPNAIEFFSFTKEVFDAKELNKTMRNDNTFMHGEVMIGGCTIMFSNTTETHASSPAGMFVYVDNADETYKKAVDEGATSVTEVGDQSYGRSGGVKDPFGNTWWITSVNN